MQQQAVQGKHQPSILITSRPFCAFDFFAGNMMRRVTERDGKSFAGMIWVGARMC
jgi:hypothetical protein